MLIKFQFNLVYISKVSVKFRGILCSQFLCLFEIIRSDSRLQRLIYNMVPGLLQEELAKREKYFESVCTDVEEKAAALTRDSWVNLKLYNEQMHASTSESSETSARRFLVRYIQCLAITPVRIIGKLLRNKLSVPLNYKVCWA